MVEIKTNILVVDDNASFCKSMVDILDAYGYNALCVMNGLEAVNKVKEMPFDLILMDIVMPVMNGIEALKNIKKIYPNTKVILMTGFSTGELIQKGLQESDHAILSKPLDIDEIIDLINYFKTSKNNE